MTASDLMAKGTRSNSRSDNAFNTHVAIDYLFQPFITEPDAICEDGVHACFLSNQVCAGLTAEGYADCKLQCSDKQALVT
jgi:hypothetical protein